MFAARGSFQGSDPKDDLRLGRLVEVEESRSAEVQGSMHRNLLKHLSQFAALAYLKPFSSLACQTCWYPDDTPTRRGIEGSA